MDFLAIANSWPVWICAFLLVATVIVQTVVYSRLCYKNANEVGLSRLDCNKSFRSGMISAIGPSLSCFISAISLCAVVGGPMAWMRLSVIGAAQTELTCASLGAAAYGVDLGGAGYTMEVMANSWATMAINGWGYLIILLIVTPRMTKIRQKITGRNPAMMGLITAGASVGLFGFMAAQHYIKLPTVPPLAISAIAATVSMFLFKAGGKKVNWLNDYAFGFAIIVGIIAGAVTG